MTIHDTHWLRAIGKIKKKNGNGIIRICNTWLMHILGEHEQQLKIIYVNNNDILRCMQHVLFFSLTHIHILLQIIYYSCQFELDFLFIIISFYKTKQYLQTISFSCSLTHKKNTLNFTNEHNVIGTQNTIRK